MKNFRAETLCLCYWLRLLAVTTALVGALVVTEQANAQFGHSDVDFGLDGNRLITNQRVYESFFPKLVI